MIFFASPPAPFIRGDLVYLKQLDETVLEPYLAMLADPETQRLTATKATFTRKSNGAIGQFLKPTPMNLSAR
jgi:hypothetical protein